MKKAKIMETSMHPSLNMEKDEKGKIISKKEYGWMIGSLLSLTASKP